MRVIQGIVVCSYGQMERQEKRASFLSCWLLASHQTFRDPRAVTQHGSLYASTGQIGEQKMLLQFISISLRASDPCPLLSECVASTLRHGMKLNIFQPAAPTTPASGPVMVCNSGCLCQLNLPLRDNTDKLDFDQRFLSPRCLCLILTPCFASQLNGSLQSLQQYSLLCITGTITKRSPGRLLKQIATILV